MENLSSMKVKGGWSMDREKFSQLAVKVFMLLVDLRRDRLALAGDAMAGTRFKDNGAVLARVESMFTEAEFMADALAKIDAALLDAARSDWWYTFEKDYDTEMAVDDSEDGENDF